MFIIAEFYRKKDFVSLQVNNAAVGPEFHFPLPSILVPCSQEKNMHAYLNLLTCKKVSAKCSCRFSNLRLFISEMQTTSC